MGFSFKSFHIEQDFCAMKVGTDGVLIGAWGKGGENILDVGTGTGLIALMMAQRFPQSKVTGIDIDENALKDAVQNIKNSKFNDRIRIEPISLQDLCKTQSNTFDAIVCNPPFFINSLKSVSESRTKARHTVSLSYTELMHCTKKLLKEDGTLSVIIPMDNVPVLKTEAIFTGFQLEELVKIFTTPKATRAKRCLLCFRKSNNNIDCQTQTVILNETDGERSQWYKELTTNFYIK